MMPQTHPESMKRFVAHIMRYSGGKQNELPSRLKNGLKQERTEIVFRIFMVDRRGEVGWGFFHMGCGLCGLEFPLAPKEGALGFLISWPRRRAEEGKGVVGLESWQQSNTEHWIWLFITIHLWYLTDGWCNILLYWIWTCLNKPSLCSIRPIAWGW